jgi:hypothetical protein
MRRVDRTEWMEWLDALAIPGAVEILGARSGAHDPLTFLGADFDPFDDTIEIVLGEGSARLRILLDAPREIWVDGGDDAPQRIVFGCTHETFEVRRRTVPTRRGKAHLTVV